MFDLMEAVAQWRTRFLRDRAFSEEDVEELEMHLIDAFETHRASGINEEDAFSLAVSSLGSIQALRPEYMRVKPLWEKVFRISRALLVGVTILYSAFFFGYLWATESTFYQDLGQRTLTITLLAKQVVLIVLPLIILMTAFQRIKNDTVRKNARIVTGLCFVLYYGGLFSLVQLKDYNLIAGYVAFPGPTSGLFWILVCSFFFKDLAIWRASLIVVVVGMILIRLPLALFAVDVSLSPQIGAFGLLLVCINLTIGLLFGYALSRPNRLASAL